MIVNCAYLGGLEQGRSVGRSDPDWHLHPACSGSVGRENRLGSQEPVSVQEGRSVGSPGLIFLSPRCARRVGRSGCVSLYCTRYNVRRLSVHVAPWGGSTGGGGGRRPVISRILSTAQFILRNLGPRSAIPRFVMSVGRATRVGPLTSQPPEVGRSVGRSDPKFASPRCARRVGRSGYASRKRHDFEFGDGRFLRTVNNQLRAA